MSFIVLYVWGGFFVCLRLSIFFLFLSLLFFPLVYTLKLVNFLIYEGSLLRREEFTSFECGLTLIVFLEFPFLSVIIFFDSSILII